jgi:hypothetical protein
MGNGFQFGLQFVNGEVQFLLSDEKVANWTVLHRVELESTTLTVEMVRFCKRVKQESNGSNAVAVFLPEPDVQTSEVSVAGHDKDQQYLHVQRTIARRMSDAADNIEAACGPVDQYGIAPVFYALKETLLSARQFIARFGLEVAYFGAIKIPRGFTSAPHLQHLEPPKRSISCYVAPAVSSVYYASFTAVFSAIALLIGTATNYSPIELATLQNDKPVYAATQYTALPADRAYHPNSRNSSMVQSLYANENGFEPLKFHSTASLTAYNMPKLDFNLPNVGMYVTRLQYPAPRSVETSINPALTAPQELDAPVFAQVAQEQFQLASLSPMQQVKPSSTFGQMASRVMPNRKFARRMDQVARIKGGFFVFIGLQQNLTKTQTVNREYSDLGQVVFIGNSTQAPISHGNSLPLHNMDRAQVSWPESQDMQLVSLVIQK